MKIKLNAVEQRLTRYLAKIRVRHFLTTRPESITLYGSTKGDYENNMIGSIGAEIAYCRAMNAFPCLEPVDRCYYDVQLYTGDRVDVKWTKNPNGPMQIKMKEPGKPWADLFVLMVGSFPEYKLVGYIDKARATADEMICTTQQSVGYAVPQSALSPTIQDVARSRDGEKADQGTSAQGASVSEAAH